MPAIHSILKNYWGYDQFRPQQEAIIHSVLLGKDTLALLPTGGGKSICFQVPAMAREGLCLVISPLIALMKDQVEALRRKGITAFAIYGGMSRKEVINALKVATDSNCKFLYVSPERLETSLFKEYLPALELNLIAVDEAHCISQWGYDFRPPYLRIAALRAECPGVPVLALTASATPAVQHDICEKLQFPSLNIFRRSFERPNLSYSVFAVDSVMHKLVDILRKVPGSSIVYCKSRKRTQWISDLLKGQGIPADHYHAGLSADDRDRKQTAWINNQCRVMVCTNAFGMGIDKPDVRTVIHADIPDCLENYYQEAGRAGRDEKKAYAVLLYQQQDLEALRQLPDIRFPSEENIRKVYQAITNYLQIPAGAGAGVYYDFDFTDFIRKFQIDPSLAMYALKALEQEGWCQFNEQVFLPAMAQFITGKDWLYEFESSHPDLEPMIKTLLRTYEGIFDQFVAIHEKTLAYLMKLDQAVVVQQLKKLQAFSIIEYNPQKDTPQLYLLQPRIQINDWKLNAVAYQQRKEQFAARVAVMLEYASANKQCRSQFIAGYFGDDTSKPCGICDNCLQQANTPLNGEEFEKIHQQLMLVLANGALPLPAIVEKMNGVRKEKVHQVIDYLQGEEKIRITEKGEISKA